MRWVLWKKPPLATEVAAGRSPSLGGVVTALIRQRRTTGSSVPSASANKDKALVAQDCAEEEMDAATPVSRLVIHAVRCSRSEFGR